MPRIPGALRNLLAGLIDYAGLYPPACLPLAIVIERYNGFLHSPESWILNRLVLPGSVLPQVRLLEDWHVTLLVEEEPGPLPRQIETLETKLACCLSLPTYCEAPLASIEGSFAKIRTGGLKPEMIPSPQRIAEFLAEAARLRIPFKATAGLHHPVRSVHPLTYERDAPRAMMHGFLNVFVAAALAWRGAQPPLLVKILEETDPAAFRFGDDDFRWGGQVLTAAEIHAARRDFAHGFGSCSFSEPVSDLRQLGLLP